MDFIEISAKTIEEAIQIGTQRLMEEGKVVSDTKVLQEPSKGFLGLIGGKDALVRLYFETVPTGSISVKEALEAVGQTVVEAAPAVEPVASVVEEVVATVGAVAAAESVKAEAVEAPAKEEVAMSKEEQQAIADKGKQFLMDMFQQMGLSFQIEKLVKDQKITFQIHGEDLGILIGKHGQTLDAIQYLTNLVANKEVARRCQIVVDVENYRARREETLIKLAHRLASKVRRSRQKVALEPMNAFERKVIHLALQQEANIYTDSEGSEPYRHVVIYYKREKRTQHQ